MKIVALMPVRNEDWALGLTARAALLWADELVIGLHACTDLSNAIATNLQDRNPGRVVIVEHLDSVWAEMAHRQALLEAARSRAATHIAMIDADEILTGNIQPDLFRSMVEKLQPGFTLQLPWLALPRSIDKYIAGGVWGNGNFVSCAFKDESAAHWTARAGYDFHHRNPMGLPLGRWAKPMVAPQGGLMHLQFLSERRLRAKQHLYIQTEMIRWPGRKAAAELSVMYGRAVYESDPYKVVCIDCPAAWWQPYRDSGLLDHLHVDDPPWQELAVFENVEKYGRDFFKGADTFGLY